MVLRDDGASVPATYRLTPQQVAFFNAFGFLRLRGIFAAEVGRLIEGFEEVFAREEPTMVITRDQDVLQQTNPPRETSYRHIIQPGFTDRSEKLRDLPGDPRVLGIAGSLMGGRAEYLSSDANLFYADTSWHPDLYGAPIEIPHVKLSFYLDTLRADTGAVRVIPGTSFHRSGFAQLMMKQLFVPPSEIRRRFGVEPDEIPCFTIDNDPGDVLVWSFRTFHASFHGGDRRRSFSLTFRQRPEGENGG
jgi:hypothetical protein